jgi:hypothetical protein
MFLLYIVLTLKLDYVKFKLVLNYPIRGGLYGVFKFVVIGSSNIFCLEKA